VASSEFINDNPTAATASREIEGTESQHVRDAVLIVARTIVAAVNRALIAQNLNGGERGDRR
jgi:hypothetical protein